MFEASVMTALFLLGVLPVTPTIAIIGIWWWRQRQRRKLQND